MEAAQALEATPILSAALCRHCGDPCGSRAIQASGDTFCCRGCAAVFTLLTESGLSGFYATDAAPGVSQRRAESRAESRFVALDLPDVRARFIEYEDEERAGVTFAVPELHCASCLWLVERLHRVNPAVIRADADLVRRTVHIWFRPAQISLRAVAEQLAAIGYEPVISTEAARLASPARRRLYLKLAVAGFAFGNVMLFSVPLYLNGAPLDAGFQRLFDTLNILFALPVLLFSAAEFFSGSWRALRAGRLTLDVPIALGLAVMFGRSVFDIVSGAGAGYMDSFTGLVFFLLIGRLLQQKAFDRIAFDRSYRSFLPLSVLVERDGATTPTALEHLRVGDRIVVRPHEVVPADARLADARGTVDYAFVTGESAPVTVHAGDLVRAGGRAIGSSLRLEVVQPVSSSRLAALWNNKAFAREKKPWLATVSDSFGALFTATATLLAFAGAIAWWPDVAMSLQVATAVLIIACPCAITLAAPITLGTAMELLGRRGLYLKHGAVTLDLARAGTVAFDKTGTLTTASGGLTAEPVGLSEGEWSLARRLAAESVHPISRAMAASGAAGTVTNCEEIPGAGLRGLVDGRRVAIGSPAFIQAECGLADSAADGTLVAVDGMVRGSVRLVTPERPGISEAMRDLDATHDTWLISGDRDADTGRWRSLFGGRVAFQQTPEDKLARVAAARAGGARVLMIGDGLNDAAALASADVGIAVSDDTACIVPACDAVIRGDRIETLPALLRFAQRARQLVIVCFVVSIVYNAAGLSLALTGRLTPLATAVLMPISSLTILALGAGGMRWFARRLPLPTETRA